MIEHHRLKNRDVVCPPKGEELLRFPSLIDALWKIEWSNHYPYKLTDEGIYVDVAPFEEVERFTNQYLEKIYGTSPDTSPFRLFSNSVERLRYYQTMSVCFFFFDAKEKIGAFKGACADWSTFYLRSALLFEKYRGKRIYKNFLEHLFQVLANAKVERICGDVVPTNRSSVSLYNKLGFYVTGFTNSDRWGALIQFTKFLNKESEKVFVRQHCASP